MVVVVSGRNRTSISFSQDIAEVSVAECSPVILDSSMVPGSSVGREIVARGKILRDMKLFNLIYFS